MRDTWALAIEALSWMQLHRISERLALNRAVKQLGIEDAGSISLAFKLVCETTRRQNYIDHLLNHALKPRSINDFKLGVQAFLRLYTYTTKIEKKTVNIREASTLARLGRAVLGWRELQPLEETLGKILSLQPTLPLKGLNDEEKVSLQTYHPLWFVKYCFRLLGRKETLHMLESTKGTLPTYIRINTLKGAEKTLLKEMQNEGVSLTKVPMLHQIYKVTGTPKPLTRTRSFENGLFYIQDKASCFAAEVASPKPGMTVLDICAAPGAKTSHLAQLMKNRGCIYSVDYSRRRMSVWKREIKRMGVKMAEPILGDATNPLPLNVEADLVVLDPPCTGSGVFGRVPWSKWRLTKRSVENMAKIQWAMINNCARHVKEKGFLVYSTCSITLEENETLIERFLKWHMDFRLVETLPKIGTPGLRGLIQCQRLYPHVHECNGFFIAKLKKVE